MAADLELTAFTPDAIAKLVARIEWQERADDGEELAMFADPVEYELAIEDAIASGDYSNARRIAEDLGDSDLVTRIVWLEHDATEPSEAIVYRGALERLGWTPGAARRAHFEHFVIGSRRDVKTFGRRRVASRSGCYRRTSRRVRRARAPGRPSSSDGADDDGASGRTARPRGWATR